MVKDENGSGDQQCLNRVVVNPGDVSHRTMSSMAHVFEELLDAEVAVDISKLREASRLGIPSRYRDLVYCYLLGVAISDKSHEMSQERIQEKDFDLLTASFAQYHMANSHGNERGDGKSAIKLCNVRRMDSSTAGLITREESVYANAVRCGTHGTTDSHTAWEKAFVYVRHHEPYRSDMQRWKTVEAALGAMQMEYCSASPDEVHILLALVLTFGSAMHQARNIFFCATSVYHILQHYGNILQDNKCMQTHCGNFLRLFRAVNATLYQHFFITGITTLEWVPGMLETLLAGRMCNEDLLHLWDYYMADVWEHLTFPLHPYVCLAILEEMTEDLIECDKVEILDRLRCLPRINAGAILKQALSIRESIHSKGLV